jgi:hypothetical protein
MGLRGPILLAVALAGFALGVAGCGSQHPSSTEEAALHREERRKELKARKERLNKALAHSSPRGIEEYANEVEAEEKERLEHPSPEAERILEERAAEREANEIESGR